MYISRLNSKTQGLRKAFINAQETDRHYNIKSLRNIDKDLAKKYTDARYYGGSLKSFWNKIKKFGKHVINSAITTTKQMYKGPKTLIDFVSKNDAVKNIIGTVGNAVGSSVGVPMLGNMINTGITSASNITDGLENVIKNIKDKNPDLMVNDIKNIVNKVKDTATEISKDLPEDQRKAVEDKVKKIYTGLPNVIKTIGAKTVDKAAGYLPLIDVSTLKEKMIKAKGKQGGMIPKWRVIKPKNASIIYKAFKLPAYDADAVGTVASSIFKGKTGVYKGEDKDVGNKSGRIYMSGASESKNKSGRIYMSGASKEKEDKNETNSLIEKIRMKLKK
jgi:hypothetical protein